MSKILLSGIPGTGKSTTATYLETKGYYHLDMEEANFGPREEFKQDKDLFLGKLGVHENIVLSWGFGPFSDRIAVDYLLGNGFQMVWLEGNHVTALRNFLEREGNDPVREAEYYGQMQMIISTGIVRALQPITIDPFTEHGDFRPTEEIAEDILRQTSSTN